MELVEQIGGALQARYTFADLCDFFAALQIKQPEGAFGSKRVFAKEALKSTPNETLLKIADDLGLSVHPLRSATLAPPRNWKNTRLLRVFISHISKDKDKATTERVNDNETPGLVI
jgi:hypothetical protein